MCVYTYIYICVCYMHIILGNVEVKWPVAVMTSLEMRARNLKDLGIRGSGSSWYKTNHPDELLWSPFLTRKNTWLFGRSPYFSSFLSGEPRKNPSFDWWGPSNVHELSHHCHRKSESSKKFSHVGFLGIPPPKNVVFLPHSPGFG